MAITQAALTRPRTPVSARALSKSPAPGRELLDPTLFPGLLISPSGGSEAGTHTAGDIVTQTTDGIDLNDLWAEFQATVQMHNNDRQRIIDLLTFSVSQPIERVPQIGDGAVFEEASEFGEPRGARITPTSFSMGYDFRWYDLAFRFTWKFLADSTEAQVSSINNLALQADSQLLLRKVLEAVFDNTVRTARIDEESVTVFPFYNGNNEVAPPDYKNKSFAIDHNHYMTTAAGTLVGQDVIDLVRNITEHGYGDQPGMSVLVIANETETDVISTFRADQADSPHDFIPIAQDFSTILAPGEQVAGAEPPPNSLRGLDVVGRYGPAIIVKENYIPSGYLLAIVSDGEDSVQNPVGIREHTNTSLRGLRLIKGRDSDYPLVDSFYGRAFGTGVRHRGAGALMQVTADAAYSPPDAYSREW